LNECLLHTFSLIKPFISQFLTVVLLTSRFLKPKPQYISVAHIYTVPKLLCSTIVSSI